MTQSVVIDTNVLVSAGLQMRSVPGQVVGQVLLRQTPVFVCPAVTDEYGVVLARPKFRKHGFPPLWMEALLLRAFHRPDPPAWPMAGPDPDDLVFLALAKATQAVLVTGNTKDFPMKIRGGVTVMTPQEWMEAQA